MKIALESSILLKADKTGIEHYTFQLYKHLIEERSKDSFLLTYIAFFTKPKPNFGIENDNTELVAMKYLPGRIYHALMKKNIAPSTDRLLHISPDVYVFPNFIRWPVARTKYTITIIYDLSFIHAKKYAPSTNSKYLCRAVPRSIKKSDHIVTISQNSKREIMDTYDTPEEKITIINPAIDHGRFMPNSENKITKVKHKFNIASKYILSVGTLEPRKNLVGLLKALQLLPKTILNEYTLVLTGGKGWMDDDIHHEYSRAKEVGSIRKTGYVPDDDLPALYSGASVFVYPSFYEGFGMPPLEAMACGTPVITSNNSSLPEVVGDAGIMIEADDTQALASSIQKVLTNEKLAKEMSKKGLAQAKKFSWEKSAEKLGRIIDGL